MTKKLERNEKACPYYKNNPQSNECALLPKTDCCELAHSSSIGYGRECFIYEMRAYYASIRTTSEKHAFRRARVLSLEIEKEV